MSPYYVKTSICGDSEWKEVTGFYVKKNGEWCEVKEGYVKTSICGDSEWKLYYSTTTIQAGIVFWTVNTTASAGTVLANGSTISAASQPALHALLTDPNNLNADGNPLFGGDLTNPRLPDIQGSNRFVRARSGNSVTEGVGVTQSDAVPSHYHYYNKISDGNGSIQLAGPPCGGYSFGGTNFSNLREPSSNTNGEIGSGTALATEGSETRPNNIAFTPVLGVEEVPTVPVGSFLWYTFNTVPNGYLLCDGSAVTTTYSDLRTLLINAGSPFGTSGSNPKLPDLVTGNRFIRGAGGSLAHGTTQSHTLATHTHNFSFVGSGSICDRSGGSGGQITTILSGPVQGVDTATETRPNCIALLPILKY